LRHFLSVCHPHNGHLKAGSIVGGSHAGVDYQEGIKIASYVGCLTNSPFDVDGESFGNPKCLGKLVETVGGEPSRNTTRRSAATAGRWPSPNRK
jgi:hypothetical protein